MSGVNDPGLQRLGLAVVVSVAVHGLILAFGGGLRAPAAPPRLIEARLLTEQVSGQPDADVRHAISRPAPAQPSVAHQRPSAPVEAARAPARREAETPAQPRMVTSRSDAAVPSLPAPSVPAAAPGAPAVAASRADASPAPVAAPSPGPASAPAPYAPPSFGARYLDNPKPAYPMVARRRGLEGTVRLEVRVSAEGIPTSVKVRDSAGHEALDEAATTAVWHWRFVPARRGGEAVEGVVVVPIRFRLGDDEAG